MDTVTLNNKEQRQLIVMNEILAGRLTGKEAAELLGISLRHTRRLLASYRREGAAGLAHGNRGRRPVNRLAAGVEAEILRLARADYRDYNDSHFKEELAERYKIKVSVPTVRRIRRQHGLSSPRRRRAPAHRRRRRRYPQTGMLLQVDASKHDWLEGRGPWLALHAAIDDATNEVPWAVFRAEEDATGYTLLVHHISQTHGLPLALYADRHTIFQSPKVATIEEQLRGLEPRSHLGRLLDELEIGLISARSAQAKGRVERLFETLQDRLVKALRRAGASNADEANVVLRRYLPRFNKRFMKLAAQPGSAYRPRLTQAQANAQVCFTYHRTVANDHTISLFGQTLALPPLAKRRSIARQVVTLRQRMDGRLAVVFQGQILGLLQPHELGPPRLEVFDSAPQHIVTAPPAATKPPAAANAQPVAGPRNGHKPAADHPWRRPGRGVRRQQRKQVQD